MKNNSSFNIKTIKLKYLIFILLIGIVAAVILGLKLGFVNVEWQTIIQTFLYKIFSVDISNMDRYTADIIWQLRLPRLLLALCVGMGLTLSGIIMQAIVQNPLADPYILGVSSGASLGATSAIFLGVGSIFGAQAIGVCAFMGALVVSFVVVFLANGKSNNNAVKLLLSGMALNAVCSSASGFITYIGSNKEGMEAITYWLMGNVANAKIFNVCVLLILIILIFFYFLRQKRILNIMLLGREAAITLGVDLNKYINFYLILNGVIVGFIVYNAGMIGFIGLVIPHMVRLLFGSNHIKLLPVAVLFGGFSAVIMDILSRTVITGVEIPLGVVFALLGAPCFIYLMLQRRYRFGGN